MITRIDLCAMAFRKSTSTDISSTSACCIPHTVQIGIAILLLHRDGRPAVANQMRVLRNTRPVCPLPSAKGWIGMKQWCSQAASTLGGGPLHGPQNGPAGYPAGLPSAPAARRGGQYRQGTSGCWKSSSTLCAATSVARADLAVHRVVCFLMGGDVVVQLAHDVLGDGEAPMWFSGTVTRCAGSTSTPSRHTCSVRKPICKSLRDAMGDIVQASITPVSMAMLPSRHTRPFPNSVPDRRFRAQDAEAPVPFILTVETGVSRPQ